MQHNNRVNRWQNKQNIYHEQTDFANLKFDQTGLIWTVSLLRAHATMVVFYANSGFVKLRCLCKQMNCTLGV